MKRWECVQVSHNTTVGKTIEDFQSKGWGLHTYSAAQLRGSVRMVVKLVDVWCRR